MRRTIYILILATITITSCRPKNIIPRNDMADIYYDFYRADRYLDVKEMHDLGDSVNIYIPIIESHGYSIDDYLTTVEYYLHKPEILTKIFKQTEAKLKERKELLDKLIAEEENRFIRWTLLDSLDIYAHNQVSGNAYYRSIRLMFFKSDTLPVTSPTIDSTILNHITSPYFLYDSLPGLYNNVPYVKKRQSAHLYSLKSSRDKNLSKPEPVKLQNKITQTRIFTKVKFNDKEDFR
ncbi:MAG: DUF4296 domain-containing protein [Bacteroidales bacterium]|nr:DUF4296 domain-containing protein [Bacteroidales bacterium]